MSTLRTTAALVAVAMALAACDSKSINEGFNLIEGKPADEAPVALKAFDPPPDYTAGSAQIAAIIEDTPDPGPPAEEGIDYLLDWGRTTEGAYYATGWNCTNVPGLRICAGNMRKPGI